MMALTFPSAKIQRDLLNSTFNMIKSRSGSADESYGIAKVFYYNVEDVVDSLRESPQRDREIFGDWAYRSGLREDDDAGADDAGDEYGKPGNLPGLCRKSWFAFQNQADYEGELKGKCP
jgi:hypothetical protein